MSVAESPPGDDRWFVPAPAALTARTAPAPATAAARPRVVLVVTAGVPDAMVTAARARARALAPTPGDVDLRVLRSAHLPVPRAVVAEAATVVLVAAEAAAAAGAAPMAALAEHATLVGVIEPGTPRALPAALVGAPLAGALHAEAPPATWRLVLDAALRHARLQAAARCATARERALRVQFADLASAGAALAGERELASLLRLVLNRARALTGSDAATLWLIERPAGAAEGAAPVLRLARAQNASVPTMHAPLREVALPLDGSSLAGWVAATGRPLVLDDVYAIPPDAPYRANHDVDRAHGYRTRSALVLPLLSGRGEPLGVLQLLNRKRAPGVHLPSAMEVAHEVVPFEPDDVLLATALAAHAAVGIEHRRLRREVETLFESFAATIVEAVESREPAVRGHAARVAGLATGLADALVDPSGAPAFDARARHALWVGALLHDVGKVGVREAVLLKSHRLDPALRAALDGRLDWLELLAELAHARGALDAVALGAERAELGELRALVGQGDAGRVALTADEVARLRTLGTRPRPTRDGPMRPLLDEAALELLAMARGNLTLAERREIEAHVAHGDALLRAIPWTPELAGVPDVVRAHHERLDGSGYPDGLAGAAIPLAARVLQVADVFDALVTAGRPYKGALTPDEALAVLREEAARGWSDAAVVEAFARAAPWRVAEGEGDRVA